MSAEQEVKDIIAQVAVAPSAKAKENLERAHKEVCQLMSSSGNSLVEICAKAETALTRDDAMAAFKEFNLISRIYLHAAPAPEDDTLLRSTLRTAHLSDKLTAAIGSAATVRKGIREWKVGILQRLALVLQKREALQLQDDEMDEELFSTFLPEPTSPLLDSDTLGERVSKKRNISAISSLTSIPKKPKVPEIASVDEVYADGSEEISTRKKVLLTRERLRAGLHNPKGLLDLIGSSTSALDQTKRLELLKAGGMSFKGTKSFSDKLNAAILQLDLGLGGHSMQDTLLFGAKVLSCPGSITKKNTTDIENNLVHGTTSWKHQNTYAKMMIAGCMNQAKRIFEKFDDVLYGPAPEQLIVETHRLIKDLLTSEECTKFLSEDTSEEAVGEGGSQVFIKKIIEAVSPIIPVTLRNKALDGGYLRTALLLLGAAEFLFSQYEQDIREKANPAGVVGMSAALHSEIKRSAFYNDKLKPVQEFARDLQSQYQTSLGLGSSFVKNAMTRGRRRSRGFRGRAPYSAYQGYSRFQMAQQPQQVPFAAAGGRGLNEGAGGDPNPLIPMTQRGICFDWRAGSCLRGGACRYRHSNR